MGGNGYKSPLLTQRMKVPTLLAHAVSTFARAFFSFQRLNMILPLILLVFEG